MGAWHAFFHPRRTASELTELRLNTDSLAAENASLQESLEAERLESSRLKGALREAESQQQRLTDRLLSLERKMADDRQLYDEQEVKIQEIAEQFDRVQELVDSYEARISRLKHKLADARRALNRTLRDTELELTPVPPAPRHLAPPPPPPAPDPPERADEDEADWYVTPPEL